MIKQHCVSKALRLLQAAHKNTKKRPGEICRHQPLNTRHFLLPEYVAQLQSIKNIEIRAQEKGYLGTLMKRRFVHTGQLLFRINPKMYRQKN